MSLAPTETLTIAGHEVVVKSYITLSEQRQALAIFMHADGKSTDEVMRAKFESTNKTIELIVVSLDGDTHNIASRITDGMPLSDAQEIIAVVDAIFAGKKKQ